LVYRPAEDSYLLNKYVERLAEGLVLDLGTGSGIQALTAASRPEVSRVLATDISVEAVREARERAGAEGLLGRVDFLVGDLFGPVRGGVFDTVVFNPPYLPSEGWELRDEASRAWSGGPTGGEVFRRFLTEAWRYLRPGGFILTVISSLTAVPLEEIEGYGYRVEVLGRARLFFEELLCLKLTPRRGRKACPGSPC